jgi:hypothetical protein
MSAAWKVRFAACIASVAIQAFTKLLLSFSDVLYTTCENGIMSTDIYNKPTDNHQYLSPQNCHPKHCTKSIRTAKLSESNASAPVNKRPKTAWGTEMSSAKEGLQQCEH